MPIKIVYWRRELPPLSEQIEGEHEIEADSPAIHYDSGSARQLLWGACYPMLLDHAEARMVQEVVRLGGSCAHVVDEKITAKVDDASAMFSLHGRFRYVMFTHPAG
ncbi:MAG: hypothetical protein ABI867_38680 [Kofleriaceae bacterium]